MSPCSNPMLGAMRTPFYRGREAEAKALFGVSQRERRRQSQSQSPPRLSGSEPGLFAIEQCHPRPGKGQAVQEVKCGLRYLGRVKLSVVHTNRVGQTLNVLLTAPPLGKLCAWPDLVLVCSGEGSRRGRQTS